MDKELLLFVIISGYKFEVEHSFFSGAMPVCILEQSTAARRNVVTATTLDQRRSLRANSLALLCQLLNFDFICAVEVFLAINNLQTIVIVLFNQILEMHLIY